jgi:hypothetical protein
MFCMKKYLGLLFLASILLIAQNKYTGIPNIANADFNGKLLAVDDQQSHPFGSFVKLHNNGNDNENSKKSDFMIKGIITASSSSSLTINNQVINIDSSVIGNVKIVGNIKNGAYAMVQGIIKNSNYYATKIIVDQRNKTDKEENVTPTISTTTTITPTPIGTESANIKHSEQSRSNFNFEILINYLKTFFASIKNSL